MMAWWRVSWHFAQTWSMSSGTQFRWKPERSLGSHPRRSPRHSKKVGTGVLEKYFERGKREGALAMGETCRLGHARQWKTTQIQLTGDGAGIVVRERQNKDRSIHTLNTLDTLLTVAVPVVSVSSMVCANCPHPSVKLKKPRNLSGSIRGRKVTLRPPFNGSQTCRNTRKVIRS